MKGAHPNETELTVSFRVRRGATAGRDQTGFAVPGGPSGALRNVRSGYYAQRNVSPDPQPPTRRRPQPQDQIFALSFSHTGARVSEVLAIRPVTIDLEAAVVRIRAADSCVIAALIPAVLQHLVASHASNLWASCVVFRTLSRDLMGRPPFRRSAGPSPGATFVIRQTDHGGLRPWRGPAWERYERFCCFSTRTCFRAIRLRRFYR